ncbi:hypothetical protein [Hansschlegelia sp. KR7-227]|uniref:hypothetical protein n=1 Tax=Hansschlegelia sp. KR7-227 TaxID=3400914 RepID=UPI003C0ED7EF
MISAIYLYDRDGDGVGVNYANYLKRIAAEFSEPNSVFLGEDRPNTTGVKLGAVADVVEDLPVAGTLSMAVRGRIFVDDETGDYTGPVTDVVFGRGLAYTPERYDFKIGADVRYQLFSSGASTDALLDSLLSGDTTPITQLGGFGRIFGSAGRDVITAPGAQSIYGMEGGDRLRGDGGANQIFGDTEDVLSVQGDNDFIWGGDGADGIYGGGGNDRIFGGDGDDHILGGRGSDRMTGGAGADQFRFLDRLTGVDHITDFEIGVDEVQFRRGKIFGDFADIQDAMSEKDGNTTITIDDGHRITLFGVLSAELSAGDFAFVA